MVKRSPEVVVIDYGVGNLLSVRRSLEYCGATVCVTNNPRLIVGGNRVVLPGVGAFGNAMSALRDLKLEPVVRETVRRGASLLGICLGMQLLLDRSEEFGTTVGLGLIPGEVRAIPSRSINGDQLKVPHIGWESIVPFGTASWHRTLLDDNQPGDAMYFVHSFMAIPAHHAHRLADCIYGGHRVPVVIKKDNVIGCQFHPEKSGELGLKFLRRFLYE